MKRDMFKLICIINVFMIFLITSYMIYNKYRTYDDYNIKNSINYSINTKDSVLVIDKINLSKKIVRANDDFSNLNDNLVYYGKLNVDDQIIIFGHSGMGYNTFFNRIDELNKNDDVDLYINKEKYPYTVYEKYLINDTDTYILNNDMNKKTLLLITCDKKNKTKRLVIELKRKIP